MEFYGDQPNSACYTTRAGRRCQRRHLLKGGRCANHGGLSTGARTEAGRAAISNAQKKRWREWRARRQ